jgi:excisionase family DNA binding protein
MDKTEITIPILSEETVERAVFRALERYHSTNPKKTNKEKETERPLSIKEACKYLGISAPTLYSWINKGLIKVCQIGKRNFLTRAELARVINDNLV